MYSLETLLYVNGVQTVDDISLFRIEKKKIILMSDIFRRRVALLLTSKELKPSHHWRKSN